MTYRPQQRWPSSSETTETARARLISTAKRRPIHADLGLPDLGLCLRSIDHPFYQFSGRRVQEFPRGVVRPAPRG
jgi:hypothetical protein